MASRTLTPLRAASQRICRPTNARNISQMPARSIVGASKVKSFLHPSTASKSASTSKTTTTPPPASSSKPSATASRTPVPATSGNPLPDAPPTPSPYPADYNAANNSNGSEAAIDWTQSYHGLGTSAFAAETAATLQAPVDPEDVEVKPDGIIYLPEIKYRRILNAAFGPGAWGLAPRGQLTVHEKLVTREYALVVHGRFVAQARGEQQYFSEEGVSTAAEGCKSNALMRCCKDLGIASELWDPRFIRKFMKEHAQQQWVEHLTTKKRKQIWLRKDDDVRYPFKKV